MRRRSLAVVVGAVVAAVASVVALSVAWPGLDARSTPAQPVSVWALQTGIGHRYARVNVAVGELDTVRQVANPSGVAQTATAAYILSENDGRLTRIDQQLPADLDEQTLRSSPSTPAGTVQASVGGDFVAYRTDAGAVYAGVLGSGHPAQLNPGGGSGDTPFSAQAVAVDAAGTVYAYSQAASEVVRYSIPSGQVTGTDAVTAPPSADAAVALTAAAGTWFLVDTDDGQVWRRGGGAPAALTLHGDVAVGQAQSGGADAWLADDSGLVRLPADGAAPTRVYGDRGTLGTPAAPAVEGGVVYAAWTGADAGTIWRSDGGAHALPYGGKQLTDDRRPLFTGRGSSLILNETRSGWVWNARTGALLPSSQNWALDDPQVAQSDQQQRVSTVVDPKPPVARPDAFGVRAGGMTVLPVLLNDYDPNDDVLSIDPKSLTGLDPHFGTLSLTDNDQQVVIDVAPDASGTATFRYRDTDGTGAGGGLYSPPTSVTLTVVPPKTNRAPQWCGVAGCLASWPSPQVAPGGTVTVPVLHGWVDPDGDPVMLRSATDESGTGSVAVTTSGDVVYQNSDPSLTRPETAQVKIEVGDTRGAVTTRTLSIRVTPKPRIVAQSFTVVQAAGAGITVDVAPHVTGTQGALTLSSVRVLGDSGAGTATADASAVVTSGGTTFDFTTSAPGTYRVAYTVTDGTSQATATVRITVLPANAPAQLATAPVVAYVRPQQDVTLDVFTAVSNPTRRVLLLSDVRPSPAAGASLSVDAVGQNYLRISGSTASGAPGLLGTVRYTVSDGTDDAGASVTGLATVYLMPPAPQLAPIAVDDTVTVRAGAEADIPVLDNDLSASGGAIVLNPASVRSSTPDALAFASGRLLRYLAPERAGDYGVRYSIYSAGSPALSATATVHVKVVSYHGDRPPRPRTLTGRVLTGQSVTIPFQSFGVSPDGDDVSLDRVMTQPASGSAALSADGNAIVYTSVAGFHGQVSFTYRVVDSHGGSGVGTVQVGVLDEQVNPSPVTFTDYVQLQIGAHNTARIDPLANDVDPTGGTLTLTDVHPDTVKTLPGGGANPEYARLAGLVSDVTAHGVTITAGAAPGTDSFLYDVRSTTGNTARGLIVVKVVRDAVPEYPVISDTVLTAQTRDRFRTGVDVVAGKVAWIGGAVSDLKLSLWGRPHGVTVQGDRLIGTPTADPQLIAFALTGTTRGGEKVTSYAFLHVPGSQDVALTLKPGLRPQQVDENASVTWDMASLVALPPGASLEVGDRLSTTKTRAHAACTSAGGTRVRYDAGAGAPWTDACVVPVRLAGQSEWTYLSVPVQITASTPVPVLRPASITVAPGQTTSYDLKSMTTWQGRADWNNVVYTTSYTGGDFSVVQHGTTLTVTGADTASPGADDVVVVGVSSQPGVAPAQLILRVGAAPSTLPQGGTVPQTCSEASGSACTIPVIGAPGEVNPLPGTPLRVVGVQAAGTCPGLSFAVADASHVVASYSGSTPGQSCTASFSVRDAQGRVTAGARNGQILLDLQGYPKAPSSVSQTAYGDGTVTLSVNPGPSSLAYPALQGFIIRSQGAKVATCTPDGTCPAISAPNGAPRTYTATAVNSVGESSGSVSTGAWAYAAPPSPSQVTAAPQVTSGGGGVVSVKVSGLDPTKTKGVQITSDQGPTVNVPLGAGSTTLSVPSYPLGSNTRTTLTVTPYSPFTVPPGFPGQTTGAPVTILANGVGAPTRPTLTLAVSSAADDGTATVTATATAGSGGDGSTTQYGIVPDGQTCTPAPGGGTATFSVYLGSSYTYTMCAASVVGGQTFGTVQTSQTVTPQPGGFRPRGYTFVVGPTAQVSGNRAQWTITADPTSDVVPPNNPDVQFSGLPSTVFDSDPGITVRFNWSKFSSRSSAVTPAPGSAPYQVWAQWQLDTCKGGQPLGLSGTSSHGDANITFDKTKAVYRDAAGTVLSTPADGAVPAEAVSVSGIGVTVDWSGQNWGLNNATAAFGGTCTPAPTPAPTDPAPAPTPTN